MGGGVAKLPNSEGHPGMRQSGMGAGVSRGRQESTSEEKCLQEERSIHCWRGVFTEGKECPQQERSVHECLGVKLVNAHGSISVCIKNVMSFITITDCDVISVTSLMLEKLPIRQMLLYQLQILVSVTRFN